MVATQQNPLYLPEYQRPHQPWICGHADDGNPCPLGPSRLGICQNPSDCQPTDVDGTYVCTRSALQGGPCSDGPMPDGKCSHHREKCSPNKALRQRRALFVCSCIGLTIGWIAIVLPQSWKNEVLVPGGLTKNHAQILSKSENRCVACHDAGDMTLVGWITNGLLHEGRGPNEEPGTSQSERCLNCHKDSFNQALALNPHGVERELLAALTKKYADEFSPDQLRLATYQQNESVACSTCHREHHGAQHNLSEMSNKQCVSCHQNQFHRFSDHPEFKNWPPPYDQHISFDHKTHGMKYFPENRTEFSCQNCHTVSGTTIVATTGYDRCSSCHDQKIAKQTDNGIVWLALPMLDPDILEEAGIDIGNWPEFASGSFEGELPSIMRSVLSSNENLRDALQVLGDDFDFENIDSDEPEHLQAVGKIALAIKSLIRDLASDDPAARSKIEIAISGKNSSSNDFVGQIPSFVFQTAQTEWFAGESLDRLLTSSEFENPTIRDSDKAKTDSGDQSPDDDLLDQDDDELLDDEANREADGSNESRLSSSSKMAARSGVSRASFEEVVLPINGWYRDDETCSIGYRPRHHADAMMTSLLEILSSGTNGASKDLLTEYGGVNSSGQCLTCHQISKGKMTKRIDAVPIQWEKANEPRLRGFTSFSHAPHLIQPKLSDCSHCHQLDSSRSDDASATVRNASDFYAISKTACISCHHPKAAGSGCVKCHDYHVHAPTNAVIRAASINEPNKKQ